MIFLVNLCCHGNEALSESIWIAYKNGIVCEFIYYLMLAEIFLDETYKSIFSLENTPKIFNTYHNDNIIHNYFRNGKLQFIAHIFIEYIN